MQRRTLLGAACAVVSMFTLAACVPEAAPAQPVDERTEMWLRLGRCEQPGDGWGGVNWSEHGPRYEGGLGFAAGTWDETRVELQAAYPMFPLPDNMGDADPDVQIAAGELLLAKYGTRPWGCARRAGLG